MPASDNGREEVLPEINQRSSAMTARKKTRLVVRSGRIGVGGRLGSDEGRERENRSGRGANVESVPVPVLQGEVNTVSCGKNLQPYLSGRCSPSFRIYRIRSRY
jgi:hypothetical protein